ncbi:MAG: hypothetical protein DRI90_02245 [Deltaproteobacteria bacterium]|nr:MAG: hypothetical protein DRI90_02245 [Deltaproteobacteria bacterium]
MAEREIRAKIEQICDNLDRQARSAGRRDARGALFPLVLGAGLVAAACGDGESGGELYGAPGGYGSTSSSGSGGATGGGGSGGETGGGSGGATGGGGAGADGGGAMEYMAPDP